MAVAPIFHRSCCVDLFSIYLLRSLHGRLCWSTRYSVKNGPPHRAACRCLHQNSPLSPPHCRLKTIERSFIVNSARNGGRWVDLDPGSLLEHEIFSQEWSAASLRNPHQDPPRCTPHCKSKTIQRFIQPYI